MANQNDDNQTGLGSDKMNPKTKHDIQSKGGQASHGGGRQSGESSESGSNRNQGQSSENKGFAAMKEQGRDEEVSEIVSQGGQSSRGGGNSQ